ncbi:MAG: glycosyltransferase family 9 protein [Bacteriovoracaceae bacterium]|nr:glycosyltransferase family 9 protein [Bacteriovoracaceae bacterium]
MKNMKNMENLKHVLISRTDNLGDVILTLPIAYFIKQQYPEVKISFLGKTYTKPILDLCPFIDQVLLWDEWEKMDNGPLLNLVESLQFNVVLHVFPRKRLATIMQMAKIPLRIGTAKRLFHWPLKCNRKLFFSRKRSDLHEAMLNIKLLAPIMNTDFISRDLMDEITSQLIRKQDLKATLRKYISDSKINLILHPKSMGSAQEWGLENFAKLINHVSLKDAFQICITGSSKELAEIKKNMYPLLTEISKAKLINTCGLFSLEELINFISHAQIFVANSTGPLHVASLYGLKTIGLFPPHEKKPMHAGRWSPLGNSVFIVAPSEGKLLNEVSWEEVAKVISKNFNLF